MTKTEFTDEVWNPVAEAQCHEERLGIPLRWRKPRRAWVGDVFHPSVPSEFAAQVWNDMAHAQRHLFMVATRYPLRMLAFLCLASSCRYRSSDGSVFHLWTNGLIVGYRDWPLPNVWIGVSVEDQATADERIPVLLQCPAALRFVSADPLRGPLNLRLFLPFVTRGRGGPLKETGGIDWVICGGESGPGSRPLQPAWVRVLQYQCAASNVPFFFKGWGDWAPADAVLRPGECTVGSRVAGDMVRVGKRRAGRVLDGKEHNEYPIIQRGKETACQIEVLPGSGPG